MNLAQLLALLQNSIQNQPNTDPLGATLPNSGQNKNTVDSKGENPKENGDNDEEEELLQDLTQEFECQEERGPPIKKKLEKILRDLLWSVFKKEKLEKVVMDTLPPKKFSKIRKNFS